MLSNLGKVTVELKLELAPSCLLASCPPGLFVFDDTLCFRNDYNEFFIVENGDVFWGGTNKPEERLAHQVYPAKIVPR